MWIIVFTPALWAIELPLATGIGAIVVNGARIRTGAIVAAGALVPEGMDVPAFTLVMGTPAKVKRAVTPDEQERFKANCQNYVKIAAIYKEEQS